jgi:iron complex outermembrane receptor protein
MMKTKPVLNGAPGLSMPTPTSVALAASLTLMLWASLSPPALAQSSSTRAEGATQTITITTSARKRKEAVQDVPMSMELLSGKDLQEAGVLRVQDIQANVPGLVVTTYQSDGNISLRGVGTGDVGLGTDQSVAIHIDGVYQAYGGAGLSRLFDVSAVEVLKGPQGTLYGRNSTAGVINLISNAPGQRFAAEADVSLGSLRTVLGQGFVNVPLSADTALRLSFAGGAGRGPITNEKEGSLVGDRDDFSAVRLGLRSQLGKARADMRLQYIEDRNQVGQALLPMPYDTAFGPGAGWADREFYIRPPEQKKSDLNAALTLTVPMGEATLTSITGYGRHRGRAVVPLFSARTEDERAIVTATEPYEQVSQELQFNFTTGRATDWVAGVFAMDSKGQDNRAIDSGPAGFLGGYTADTRAQASGRTLAAFADVSHPLSSTFKLNGGLRYTWEKKEATSFGLGPFDVNPALSASKTWTALSGRLGFDWQLSKASKLWGGLSEGFKSGGVIPLANNGGGGVCEGGAFDPSGCAITIYKPETLRALELGQKTTLPGGAGFVNAAVFLYDYRDKVEYYQYDLSNPLSFTFNNAQKAQVKGLELSGDFRLSKHLRADIAATFLDTEYTRFVDGAGGDIATGKQLARSPKASATVALAGDKIALAGGALRFRLEYVWRDKIYFDFFNDNIGAHTYERAIGLFNAAVGWAPAGSSWSLYANARNLSNARYLEFARSDAPGVIAAPGRTVQVGANLKF